MFISSHNKNNSFNTNNNDFNIFIYVKFKNTNILMYTIPI